MNFLSAQHKRFVDQLLANKVRFIIIGGYASIYYGVRRSTGDLDILIEPTPKNGKALIKALKDLNLKVPAINDEEFEGELVLSFGFEPEAVDIITKAPGIDFDSAFKRAAKVSISGISARLIDIHDLIKNKQTLNRKGDKALLDKFDLESLKKIARLKDGPA